MIRADQIRPERVEWLWKDRIPFGAVTILAGDPGLGKSLLTVWLAAQLTIGELGGSGPGNVVLSSAEDAVGQIVRPRLEAADAALERVVFVEIPRDGFFTPPVMPDDVPELEKVMREDKARLLVLDPLTAHLAARVDSWKDQSIRTALLPLRALAEKTAAAVVIVAHLNKGQGTNPLHRLGGSIGLPATARSVLLLGRDPADPAGAEGDRRVLAQVKSNVGPPAESLSLQIGTGGKDADSARMVLLGSSPYSGSDLLKAAYSGQESKQAQAIEFLREQLAEGPRLSRELYELAAGRGISDTTLNRAKAGLDITAKKGGFNGGWSWHPPGQSLGDVGPADADDGSQSHSGLFGGDGEDVDRPPNWNAPC